jgi:hypothetical protein
MAYNSAKSWQINGCDMMQTYRNVLAVAALAVLGYLFHVFHSGLIINGKIQGRWISVDNSEYIIFTSGEYMNSTKSGTYQIKGNKIIFDLDTEYNIRVKKGETLIINEHYFRESN